jgi:hypothetical protein
VVLHVCDVEIPGTVQSEVRGSMELRQDARPAAPRVSTRV